MQRDHLKLLLAWSTLINYAILIVWFVAFVAAHDWLREMHGRWFRLSPDQFDLAHYLGMAIYKIGIMLFNLVPYLALRIADKRKEG
jgi:hypothetical protein